MTFTAPFLSLNIWDRKIMAANFFHESILKTSNQNTVSHFFDFQFFWKDILLQSWETIFLYFCYSFFYKMLSIFWQKTKFKKMRYGIWIQSLLFLMQVERRSYLFNFSRVKTKNIDNFLEKTFWNICLQSFFWFWKQIITLNLYQ